MSEISVARSAFLLSLKIRGWTGRKTDRPTSDEILQQKGAQRESGAFVKRLLGKCDELAHLNSMSTSSRKRIESLCIPYTVRGVFFVPITNYEKVMGVVEEERKLFYERLDDFKSKYPEIIERARQNNKELFDETELPSVEELEHKFDFDWQVMQVPDPEKIDGFFAIPQMENEMKENMVEQNEKLREKTRNVLKARLREELVGVRERFHKYTGKKGGSFRNTLVEKAVELTKETKNLNIFEDDRIDNWADRIISLFNDKSSLHFKENDFDRANAVNELDKILMEMQ